LPVCDAVVAEWAVDDVVGCLGVDGIVAGAAGDHFIAFATEDAACCFWGINNVFTPVSAKIVPLPSPVIRLSSFWAWNTEVAVISELRLLGKP